MNLLTKTEWNYPGDLTMTDPWVKFLGPYFWEGFYKRIEELGYPTFLLSPAKDYFINMAEKML